MTKPLPVSVSLEPALDDQVAEIAAHLDRSKAWVASWDGPDEKPKPKCG